MKRKLKNASFLIVSCTNTPATSTFDLEHFRAARLKEGFSDTGWHYIITRDGGAYADCPLDEVGTHTQGRDSVSVGVLLEGGAGADGKVEANYTAAQYATLNILLWNVKQVHPLINPIGLHDVNPTAKPHFNVLDFFGEHYDNPS